MKRFAQQLGKPEPEIAPEAFQKLLDYSWPGNVRELQNAIEYAVVLARQNVITDQGIAGGSAVAGGAAENRTRYRRAGAAPQSLDDMERNAILQALAQTHGNKKSAAQLLGIQRPTLYNKMKRFGIQL